MRVAFLVLALAATSAFAAPAETGKAAALASVDKVREGGHGGRSCPPIGGARARGLIFWSAPGPPARGRLPPPARPTPLMLMKFTVSTVSPHRDRNLTRPSTPR